MAFTYAYSGAYYDAVDAAELATEPEEHDDRPRLTTADLMRALEEAEGGVVELEAARVAEGTVSDMTRTSTSRLTRRQIERLREIESAPSYLADNGRGMHAARAWWNTYGSLAERGLARLVHCHSGLVAAYEITDSGREVLKREDERDLVEEAGLC